MCNCINADLQAENEELKKQVAALTQALETQNRENQPYIEELEAAHSNALNLLARVQLNGKVPEGLWDDIHKFISIKTINATGGDKPEQE